MLEEVGQHGEATRLPRSSTPYALFTHRDLTADCESPVKVHGADYSVQRGGEPVRGPRVRPALRINTPPASQRALCGTRSSEEELLAPFTFRSSASGRRAIGKAQKMELIKGARLDSALALSGGSEYRKRGTGSNALGVGKSERAGRSRL